MIIDNVKEIWYPHAEDDEERSWSISTIQEYGGWHTDSGSKGYGLPKELAQWICEKLNSTKEICPYKNTYTGTWEKIIELPRLSITEENPYEYR
jgi:hypothetical protein